MLGRGVSLCEQSDGKTTTQCGETEERRPQSAAQDQPKAAWPDKTVSMLAIEVSGYQKSEITVGFRCHAATAAFTFAPTDCSIASCAANRARQPVLARSICGLVCILMSE